jgi:hypothetical protein
LVLITENSFEEEIFVDEDAHVRKKSKLHDFGKYYRKRP